MLRVIFYQCSRLLSFSAPKCLLHPSGESGERVIFHLAALKQTLVMDGFSKKVFDTFPYVAKFDDEVELVPNFKPKKIELWVDFYNLFHLFFLCILCPAAPSEENKQIAIPCL